MWPIHLLGFFPPTLAPSHQFLSRFRPSRVVVRRKSCARSQVGSNVGLMDSKRLPESSFSHFVVHHGVIYQQTAQQQACRAAGESADSVSNNDGIVSIFVRGQHDSGYIILVKMQCGASHHLAGFPSLEYCFVLHVKCSFG